jgi:hypothetical protein
LCVYSEHTGYPGRGSNWTRKPSSGKASGPSRDEVGTPDVADRHPGYRYTASRGGRKGVPTTWLASLPVRTTRSRSGCGSPAEKRPAPERISRERSGSTVRRDGGSVASGDRTTVEWPGRCVERSTVSTGNGKRRPSESRPSASPRIGDSAAKHAPNGVSNASRSWVTTGLIVGRLQPDENPPKYQCSIMKTYFLGLVNRGRTAVHDWARKVERQWYRSEPERDRQHGDERRSNNAAGRPTWANRAERPRFAAVNACGSRRVYEPSGFRTSAVSSASGFVERANATDPAYRNRYVVVENRIAINIIFMLL